MQYVEFYVTHDGESIANGTYEDGVPLEKILDDMRLDKEWDFVRITDSTGETMTVERIGN